MDTNTRQKTPDITPQSLYMNIDTRQKTPDMMLQSLFMDTNTRQQTPDMTPQSLYMDADNRHDATVNKTSIWFLIFHIHTQVSSPRVKKTDKKEDIWE